MATTSLSLLKKAPKASTKAADEVKAEVTPEPEQEEVMEATPVEAETPDTEEEEVEVDVDVLTIPQLDALVKDHELEVPETWWKQIDGVKKMTGPDKKAWLKAQFEETDEEAEEADVAPEPEPETKPAKKTHKSEKATTAGAKAASKEMTTVTPAATGEIVEPDALTDMIHEIENLKEKEARKLAVELNNEAEFTFFKLGGVLSVIQANNWFEPYASFREYVAQEHGLMYRKAMYLIGIYNDMAAQSIPWESIQHVGWTKMSIMSSVLTPENVDEWVKLASENNAPTLAEMVRNAKMEGGSAGALSNGASSEVVTTKSFKLHADQKETVESALEKAKEDSKTDVDSVAFEYICLDFLGSKKSKPVPLHLQLKKVGIEEALAALTKAFPDTDFSVDVGD